MSETTYYSALHYAKKAEKSAQEAAEKAASVNAENLVKTYGDNTIEGTLTVADNSNHPITIEGMAGTTATGFQITDSNGQGETDLEHYATGDRYGTRLLNRSTATGKEFNVDMYQTTAGKSVLDLSKADSVLIKGDKDLLTNVVDVTSNQTIGGQKVFTNQVEFHNEGMTWSTSSAAGARDNRFRCKFYQYGLSDEVYPAAAVFSGIHHYDKNNFEYGTIFSSMSPTGIVQTNLWVHTPKGTAATMGIQQDANGNTSTYAPTPATSDNSTQIATTAFVNNKLQVVDSLPSSPTAGVFYFIKE